MCRPARIVEAEVLHRVADRARTVDRSRRAVERRERAVAGELHDDTTRAGHVPLDDAVVRGEGRRPRLVAQLRGAFGRSDDVGEQHGRQHAVRRCSAAFAGEERLDLVEHAVGVAGEPHVVVAVELHQSRVRDALGEILRVFATHVAVATPVQQQCRRLDALERGADVGAQDTGRATP